MKVIKPLRQGIIYRCFENEDRSYFVVTVFSFFPFTPRGRLLSEIDMWKFAAGELGKDTILDFGMPKPRGEVVLTGKFFSPGGRPVPGGKVRLKLAGIDKTLYVFGDRFWKRGPGGLTKITEPEPVTVMDISYENAFGGPDYKENPLGKGHAPVLLETGQKLHPLPNIEDPKHLVTLLEDRPAPASFAPLDMMWPQRLSKAGTFDEKWLNERFPGLAEDLDWTYYNTVPADQQIDGFFTGDESFEIEGMHPEKQVLTGDIPGIRSRCFVNQNMEGNTVFKEMELHPDTVWLFPHAEKGIVTCRGTMEIGTDDAEDISHLLLAYERLSDEKKPLNHYQEALLKRLDKEKGYLFSLNEKDLIPPGEKSAMADIQGGDEARLLTGEGILMGNMKKRVEREKDKIRAQLKEAGIDPAKCDFEPEETPEVDLDNGEDLERYIKQAKERQAEEEEKARKLLAEQGFDYEQLVEKGGDEPDTQLRFSAEKTIAQLRDLRISDPETEKRLYRAEEMFNRAYREYGYHFPPAPLPAEDARKRMRDDVVARHEKGERFGGRDLTGADLSRLNLRGIDLRGAFLERADLSGADLEGADLSECVLVRANLSNAKLKSAKMTSAGLGDANLSGADLRAADLAKAVLVKATLSHADLSNANLAEADLSEAVLAQATMREALMSKCRLMESDMTNAVLIGADLSEGLFLNASLRNCDFSRANLSSAILVGVTADGSCFREAELHNMRILNESSFQGADFSNAKLTQANLRGSNLSKSNFERADVSESDFSECDLNEANFYQANGKGTQFVKADLANARMVAVNLFGGSLQKASLDGTDLQGANLCMVNFMKVKFRNTNVGQANLAKTFIQRWISK